jgi:hypothetical protein
MGRERDDARRIRRDLDRDAAVVGELRGGKGSGKKRACKKNQGQIDFLRVVADAAAVAKIESDPDFLSAA